MKLDKVQYDQLNSKQKEIFNFQKVAGLLAEYGYNCIKLADDWNGADFLAYHFDGVETLKVQLKSRITIDKKYMTIPNICMCFPINGDWFLIPHDELIEQIRTISPTWLNSKSWLENGSYTASSSMKLSKALSEYKL
jgi:hypothetical protein